MSFSIAECLKRAPELALVSDSPRLDCEVLLCHVLQQERVWLFTWPEYVLTQAENKQFDTVFARRRKGEPVAYITGFREFWSLNLEVNNSTLIPRPDTEILVEMALSIFADQREVDFLDLGTGTGAIALALASEQPQWQGTGIDKSTEAVALARRNGDRLGITNVHWQQSDWFSHLTSERFDMIVANPPYIASDDQHLHEGDVRFEPRSALVAADKGLRDIALIAREARYFLKQSGWVLIEHGFTQAQAVRALLTDNGYAVVSSHYDLNGHERITLAQWC